MNREKFSHYLPLVVFTALMIAAAGWVAGIAVNHSLSESWTGRTQHLLAACILTVLGGAASLLHLGRKERAHLAVLGAARSWLSREVLAAGSFFGLTCLSLLLDFTGQEGAVLTACLCGAGASAVVLMITMGMIYQLPQHLTWRTPAAALAPLVSALYLAACFILFGSMDFNLEFSFLVLWILDLILWWKRFAAYLRTESFHRTRLFPELKRWMWGGSALRLAAAISVLPAIVLGSAETAFGLITLLIVIDRFCFYAGAAKATPESEMAGLKDERMKAASGSSTKGPSRRLCPGSPP